MKGLLLKDIYNLKLYIRQYLLLMVAFCIFGIGMDMSSYVSYMSLVLGINIGFSAFAMDEAGGYAYFLSCPLGRKTMVREKYLTMILSSVFIFIYSWIGEFLNRLINGSAAEYWMVQILIFEGIYFILMSVLVPTAYRYGVEKTRLIMMAMIMLPVVVVFLASHLIQIESFVRMFRTLSSVAPFVFFVVSLLMMGGSYRISLRVFEKMEF